jgi:hypothetical protein
VLGGIVGVRAVAERPVRSRSSQTVIAIAIGEHRCSAADRDRGDRTASRQALLSSSFPLDFMRFPGCMRCTSRFIGGEGCNP